MHLLDVLVRLPTLYSVKVAPRPPDGMAASADRGTTEAAARHLAKYIFPRQFGLHNAFTSPKARVSVDVLPDYTDREVEIKVLVDSRSLVVRGLQALTVVY